jgi:hypothetical protein
MNDFLIKELLSKPVSMIRIYTRFGVGWSFKVVVCYVMHEDDTRVLE